MQYRGSLRVLDAHHGKVHVVAQPTPPRAAVVAHEEHHVLAKARPAYGCMYVCMYACMPVYIFPPPLE